MAKLTKNEARLHRQACELINLTRDLTEDEKHFVLEHWQESSTAANSLDGAFFTPLGLAQDVAIEMGERPRRVIDLGAGIGHLTFACRRLFAHRWNGEPRRELVCVERNPDYVRVGRKILPEATWICADIFDLPGMNLGVFDCAIANPPFGAITRAGNAPGYSGRRCEYHVIAIAAGLAGSGVFIVPQESAPFRYSANPENYEEHADAEYERFRRATGIELGNNCGMDTSAYDEEWRGVSPRVEIVTCDFTSHVGVPGPGAASDGQLSLVLN
ncbi:hypothetical protein [Saccharopolyspora taberi]|uniref:Methyltransferase n=1 Tax=Saccharopolyspora taberi TaxID=60895 RepID=A0ABN3V960_9PSEU